MGDEHDEEPAPETAAPEPKRESQVEVGFDGLPDVAEDYPPADEQTLRIAGLGCIVLILATVLSFTWVFGMAFDDLSKLDSRGVEVVTQDEAAEEEAERLRPPDVATTTNDGPHRWHASWQEGAEAAQAANRPVLIYFEATWAVASAQVHERVFAVPDVAERMGSYELVRIDMTRQSPEARAVAERYGVAGVPAIVLARADGSRLVEEPVRVDVEGVSEALDAGLRAHRDQ